MTRTMYSRCFILAIFLVCALASTAHAKLTLTLVNKTDRKIFVALCHDPGSAIITKGWYSVNANSTKTVKVNLDIRGSYLGYYAKNSPAKGKKKLIWASDGKEYPNKLPVHPTKPFENILSQGGGEDKVMKGSIMVGFRKLKLNTARDGNGSCKITFAAN